MSEEMEYAEMLEIPVNTVNVVKKKNIFKRKSQEEDVKQKAIDLSNERFNRKNAMPTPQPIVPKVEQEQSAPSDGWETCLQEIPSYTSQEAKQTTKRTHNKWDNILFAETVAVCVLAVGIFLTNVFLPQSAINTFLGKGPQANAEAIYSDMPLCPVVSELSSANVTVNEGGVISFTGECAVYPVCNGMVANVLQEEGVYTVQIAHTSDFYSIITGVSDVYYAVGQAVKGRVPVARSDGKAEVKISLFNKGQLLNCYSLDGTLPVWKS